MSVKDNSDYTKARTKLFDLIPEVFKSDANRALFTNLFDRYLTKQESVNAVGYVGKGNSNALKSRQLEEPTSHRQAFQLQPVLHSKVGTVDHLSSWDDLRNKYIRNGVDIEKFDKWGEVQQFNWVPPVDIDKLINYSDYYWYDENNSSVTEYITMRSRCTTAVAKANFWQRLVDQYGNEFPINELLEVVDPSVLPTFNVVSLTPGTDEIIADGNITNDILVLQYINISGTANDNGIYQITTSPTYDISTDRSTFKVLPGSITTTENHGTISLRRYNRIQLLGEYHRLLESGFVFYVRNTTNTELDNAFWQSTGAEYDSNTDKTTVTFASYVTSDVQGGVISLQENLNFYLAERSCQCDGDIGWDVTGWDDNPSTPIWDGDLAILLANISNQMAPISNGTEGELWYDTISDQLLQYSVATNWKVLYNNFSVIIKSTEGFALWDYAADCGIATTVPSASQWTTTNFWLHKTDVPNFAKAKRAAMPILEFDWDLELNEWIYTKYNWKYRAEKALLFNSVTYDPSLIELQPISDWTLSGTAIEIDPKYGDLTDFFVPGTIFQSQNTSDFYTVLYSTYSRSTLTYPYRTTIVLTSTIPSGLIANDPLFPTRTSQGDPWKNYGDHWLFDIPDNDTPTAHQPINPFILPTLNAPTTSTPDYDYMVGYGSQLYSVTTTNIVSVFTLDSVILPGASLPLTEQAMVGKNDIRVYINDERQYGTYSENIITTNGIDFVSGITFIPNKEPLKFDDVRIEVGVSAIEDIGNYLVPVRTIEDNVSYASAPIEYTSIIKYRKTEQIKTNINQYPLFDIHNVDSTPANEVNAIFGYDTSPDAPINFAVRRRTVQDSTNKIFSFNQFILDSDNGVLKPWRDYSNKGNDIWYNPLSRELLFFDTLSWSTKTDMGNHYRKAVISDVAPIGWELNINGIYWVDTAHELVFQRSGSTWVPITKVDITTSDSTLQTIWRKGLNNETYTPSKVDWKDRTKQQYDTESELFILKTIEELLANDNTLSLITAKIQATSKWLISQVNPHSPSGIWIGDWEVPDPLYFNQLNENRKILTSRELLTHFNDIIDGQPHIPGYVGPDDSMFHLISTNDVNYGFGGTIHEYNDSYDTAFSSTFVDNVTPLTLFDYAHDQYESLLNNLEEIFKRNAVTYFTNTTQASLVHFNQIIASDVILHHELNDNASLVYGDSTTFTDVAGPNDLGIRNWIATLPYLKLIYATQPQKLTDTHSGLNQVLHHDGHRRDYKIEQAAIEELIANVINTPDNRTNFPGPQDPSLDTFGRMSANLPPNTDLEFSIEFNTSIIDRSGVYWYYTSSTRILYRLTAIVSNQEPDFALPDGTLWFDVTAGVETLREKITNTSGVVKWTVVIGNVVGDGRLHNGTNPLDLNTATRSAWSIIDLDDIIIDIILEAEMRLYANVPTISQLRYNFDATKQSDVVQYTSLLEKSFLDYVTQLGIVGPYINSTYDATNPFTWNYTYSVPGIGFNIVSTDPINNTITIQGNYIAYFDPCQASTPSFSACPSQIQFFIKNSLTNDGKWATKVATSSTPVVSVTGIAPNELTTIRVIGTVSPGDSGLIYTGLLPSSQNNGSESGGDWKDYYTKLYNTPYPHLEPWKLQGYKDQPSWWELEYTNNDIKKWGNRRWKYKHGFAIVNILDTTGNGSYDSFVTEGDFRELFPTGYPFNIDASTSNNGTYNIDALRDASQNPIVINRVILGNIGTSSIVLNGNVVTKMPIGMGFTVVDNTGKSLTSFIIQSSTFTGPPGNETIILVEEAIISDAGFSSPADNATIGGATYDNDTNRMTLHVANSALVNVSGGRVTLSVGMWEQIRIGSIRAGEKYPNNVVSITGNPGTDVAVYGTLDPNMPTFNYFSVNINNDNISSDGGTTNFAPDEVLPPYWDYVPQFGSNVIPFDRTIRSVFFNFSTEITNPSSDYLFGDSGPVEFDWRVSSQFLYDQLTVSYKLDPIRLVTHTFGIDFIKVGGMQIDSRANKVLSHNRTNFHGEIINDKLLQVSGTNQWYVNFNRFAGFDVSLADFRTMWVNWTAPLTYQMASFVDTESISINHRLVPLSSSDYQLVAKRSPAVEDFWNDAFDVSILTIPPKLISHNTQSDWKVELNTHAARSRAIKYYDVHNYQFGIDTTTNMCTLYKWYIIKSDSFANTITVNEDQTETFIPGRGVTISDSTGNNGSYAILYSVHDIPNNHTTVYLDGSISAPTGDGIIVVNYRQIPWITGDVVYLSSTYLLPAPLEGDNINGMYKYFIGVIDQTNFRLSLTQQNAFDGIYVDIINVGTGNSYVGQVLGTFNALESKHTSTLWRRYAVDKTNVLSFNTPHIIHGIQTVVNIIHGYDIYSQSDGWRINDEHNNTDFNTNRLVSWQLEIERFIDSAYSLRTTRGTINDRYNVSVDYTTDIWTFVDPDTYMITGDRVNIISSNILPSPLIHGLRYYIIRDTLTTFRLATSKLNAVSKIAIDITSNGVGTLSISNARNITYTAPKIEINPMREGVWFKPNKGIVSDVISGPTEDARNQQLLFDQYGRHLTLDQVQMYREDLRTQISVIPGMLNDVELGSDLANPYNNIHLGGAHIFIDTFEHVTVFNNYTTAGLLIYDPFIGLNLTKIEYNLERQPNFTQRPNMGGFFFETFFNQNASLKRNVEANIEDLRYAYNTYEMKENNILTKESRKTLGYDNSMKYLDDLNLNDKSQFIFWRGMIQQKGSINDVKAFINSRRFIDAKVDEYWAYKVADFGSALEREYPEMYVTTIDSKSNDFRVEFLTEYNPIADQGFVGIKGTDEDRWYRQPDQIEILRDNGQNLYFDLDPTVRLSSTDSNIAVVDTTGIQTFTVNGVDSGSWQTTGVPTDQSNQPILRHNLEASSIIMTIQYYTDGHTTSAQGNSGTLYYTDNYLLGAGSIRVFVDGIEQMIGIDWNEPTLVIPGGLFGGTIVFTSNVPTGAAISISYDISTLQPNIHFQYISSNIIRLVSRVIFPANSSQYIDFNFIIWGMNLNEYAQNPARLVDREAETTLLSIQIWDPARGNQYYQSLQNIQLQNIQDMAIYNNGTNSTPQVGPWGKHNIGTTWLDILELDYVSYYDEQKFPSVDDRLNLWGQLAGWGNGKIYEWVSSDVPPTEWDVIAVKESGNAQIPEAKRKSGKARKVLFENTSTVVGSPTWVPLRLKFEEFDAAIEGIDNLDGTYGFLLVSLTGLVDVYVNGVLTINQSPIVTPFVVAAKESDRVRFVTRIPTQLEIDDANAAAIAGATPIPYNQDYQYSTVNWYDKLNNQHTNYYFWVEDKETIDKTTTRTLTCKVAEQQMLTIPIPYMVMQKILQDGPIITEPNTLLSRDEIYNATTGQTIFSVGLPIAPNADIMVLVNGFELLPIDFTVGSQTLTLTNALTSGDIVEIKYMGLYDITSIVPLRFVQNIVRGLRGVVEADRRYTIQYTRDFTLRMDLQEK